VSEVNAFKSLSLCTTICVGILAVAACTIHLRGDEDQPESTTSVGRDFDPMPAELERCRTISYEQKEGLAGCRKLWADKRRQFLGVDRGSPSNPEQSDSGARPPASAKDQSRMPSGLFPGTF
jgi:conjugative transfer region protein TrbK